MGKEDRYAHLGDGTEPPAPANATDADAEEPDRVTISDGTDELRLDLSETDLTVADVEAALRRHERGRDLTRESESSGEGPRPPWLAGVEFSRFWTRSLLTTGALGLRLGARGLTAMRRQSAPSE